MRIFLLLLAVPQVVFAADCDSNWKELRSSLLAYKELHYLGTIPGMPSGAIEMTVVEKPVDKGADALDVSTKTDIKGLPIKLPNLDNHVSHFTKAKFCADIAKSDGDVTLDGQNPGAVMSEIFRGKPKRTEKVTVPAGTYNAAYYEMKAKAKQAAQVTNVKLWVAEINGHRTPVRTLVAMENSGMTFDIQLKKAVKR